MQRLLGVETQRQNQPHLGDIQHEDHSEQAPEHPRGRPAPLELLRPPGPGQHRKKTQGVDVPEPHRGLGPAVGREGLGDREGDDQMEDAEAENHRSAGGQAVVLAEPSEEHRADDPGGAGTAGGDYAEGGRALLHGHDVRHHCLGEEHAEAPRHQRHHSHQAQVGPQFLRALVQAEGVHAPPGQAGGQGPDHHQGPTAVAVGDTAPEGG
mmetsp:Transcript_142622/g.319053  ORF Transcript_142622/g.319053 Transcript_142622/m.319053 type:complete len:209 (-) Transcript_142622:273-899(-)